MAMRSHIVVLQLGKGSRAQFFMPSIRLVLDILHAEHRVRYHAV